MQENKVGDLVAGFCQGELILGYINGVKSGNVRCFSIDWFDDEGIEYMYSLSDIEGFKEQLKEEMYAGT